MKNYLNNKQMNDILFTFHLLEQNTKTVNEWQKHNNLTTTEAGHLRKAITWTEKFVEAVLSRMGPKEVDKVHKRTIKAMEEPVRIIDKWMEQRIFGTFDTEYEIVKIERPQFEKLCMACIGHYCKDCKNSYNDCDIYDILDDNLMARAELKPNCPYAYISDEKRLEMQKEKELRELKKLEKKAGSKRSRKKKANRYDEDDEVIEYNFKAKGR